MVRRRVAFSAPSASTGAARRDAHAPRRGGQGRQARLGRSRTRASSRDSGSAGDWSAGTGTGRASSPSSGSHADGESGVSGERLIFLLTRTRGVHSESTCAELAAERAEVRHYVHPFVALVRRQMQALEAQDVEVVATTDLIPCEPRGPLLDGTALTVQLVSGLAPVIALVVVAALSVLGALLAAVASPWRPAPPTPSLQSCLGRALASLLPSWSAWDDSPLVRPF